MLALTQIWWSWNCPAIHKALVAALHDHWLPRAEAVLQANASAGRHPADWDELTKLRRNPRNVRRVIAGASAATAGFLIGVAAHLGMEVREMFPTTTAWVAGAAAQLSRKPLAEKDYRVYAEFVLGEAAVAAGNGREDVEQLLRKLSPAVREAILRVGRAIGPALEEADRSLSERET